jgi:hypothetical protein
MSDLGQKATSTGDGITSVLPPTTDINLWHDGGPPLCLIGLDWPGEKSRLFAGLPFACEGDDRHSGLFLIKATDAASSRGSPATNVSQDEVPADHSIIIGRLGHLRLRPSAQPDRLVPC